MKSSRIRTATVGVIVDPNWYIRVFNEPIENFVFSYTKFYHGWPGVREYEVQGRNIAEICQEAEKQALAFELRRYLGVQRLVAGRIARILSHVGNRAG